MLNMQLDFDFALLDSVRSMRSSLLEALVDELKAKHIQTTVALLPDQE